MNSSAILARTEESLRSLLSGEESGNREAQINKRFPRLLKNQLVAKNLIQT